ncbi:NAD(P)/FAD-dependent oxidoreductase [Listeria booriae]|uniref:NADH dehydrogenase n=1 Tax=Listeria booriae TaxID=1552123 RepID=A0A099W552_9LIST|nr:NAD(P)/FAD-dependent oxidoreductase [Listeria booriae]KGL39891.1 NADH dehydrogenase [Listeria booriae]MBC1890515.1 NAD(P)/FAD-dependent oxidoreductase [Listeria booriae]MBC1898608.1 NAD(P)/FAD-dependent oxidoreductase [Listeria booriae]MBC2079992.1 NAD(P)/FAD-dependent oxidoreductase [Listeria booriae]MBC2100583.1 NAD(P)/FAD-dependent oxidoreductase [Listeria booriae]
MSKPKIVILGAGYGGLKTLRKLQQLNVEADLVLVNKNDYHHETTWLHEAAAGTLDADKLMYPIAKVVNPTKTTFIQDTVKKINKDDKTVTLTGKGDISYDFLLIALGSEAETFGISGLKEYAYTITSIDSVKRIRAQIEGSFAKWKTEQRDELLTIVVGGAGFTGIEFLGELTNRIPELVKKYDVPREKVRIVCMEASPKVLPQFDAKLVDYGVGVLEDRGVEFHVGTPVKEATAAGIKYAKSETEDVEIKAATVIWAAGVRGNSVIEASGFEAGRGRVKVNDDLTVPGNEEILIIGDCSLMINPENDRPYPPTAQIAMQQADIAAANLAKLAKGITGELAPFVYHEKGTVCSIGDNDAIGVVMGRSLKGYPASVMKKVIDDRALFQIGGTGVMMNKGKFKFYK